MIIWQASTPPAHLVMVEAVDELWVQTAHPSREPFALACVDSRASTVEAGSHALHSTHATNDGHAVVSTSLPAHSTIMCCCSRSH